MTNDLERLKVAQWVLERNLGWIAAADIKVGVAIALDTAMLGVLASTFNDLQAIERSSSASFFTVVAAISIVVAIVFAAMAVFPRINGPQQSLIFFGCVAQHHCPNYVTKFRSASEDEMLEDCLVQVHRNAEIAREKFRWVGKSMKWSFFSVIPWIAALALLKN